MSPSQTNVYAAPLDDSPTLNDLRLGSYAAAPATAKKSTVGFTGIVLVAALAAGAFVMFDPLGMKASHPPAPGPAPLAMAPVAPAVRLAPPAADMTSQLATPVPAPALAPAKPLAQPEPVTKSAPRASAGPAARASVTRHRTTTTVTDSPDNNTRTTTTGAAAKPEPVEGSKPVSAASSSAPEAQGDSN